MTKKELSALLHTLNIPVAYDHFDEAQSLPYIAYVRPDADIISADNKVYARFDNYRVELYTDKKDVSLEQSIEQLFDDNDIYYDVSETYIENEKMYEVIYEIQI